MGAELREFWRDEQAADHPIVAYCTVVLVVIFVRGPALPGWPLYAGAHLAVIVAVFLTVRFCTGATTGLRRLWRAWDAYAYIGLLFYMTTKIVHPINPNDWDYTLIAIDRAIGGLALLQWTQTWTNRTIDEVMKVVWVSYYFLPLLPGLVLYLRPDRAGFQEAKVILVLGFLVSFVGYFLFPALGPLHHKAELGLTNPTTGVLVAGHLKKAVTAAVGKEGRYMLPSGHALASALVIVILVRNRTGWVAACGVPYCLLIIASTLVMRYHYVIDVAVALALVPPVVWLGIRMHRQERSVAGGAS